MLKHAEIAGWQSLNTLGAKILGNESVREGKEDGQLENVISPKSWGQKPFMYPSMPLRAERTDL